MKKLKTLFFIIFLANITIYNDCVSQSGTPFITNYSNKINNQIFSIIQDNNKTMLFASRKGILTFDGINIDNIELSRLPVSLYNHSKSGNVFVGCYGDFGYLFKNDKGEYIYKSLKPDTLKIGFVGKINADDEFVYFLTEEFIVSLSLAKLSNPYIIKTEPASFLSYFFNIDNKIYVINQDDRLYLLNNLLLLPLYIKKPANISQTICAIKYSEGKVILGIGNKLYLFDGKNFYDFPIKDQKYLDACVLTGGISLNDTSFVLTTVIGGAMVISKNTGKTLYTINYQSGLPDDEIFSAAKDIDGGLWLSHSLGISRVDLSIPITKFSSYQGISGNLMSVINFNNTIYVGTNNGLFYLTEIKNYETKEIDIKVKVPEQSDVNNQNKQIVQKSLSEEKQAEEQPVTNEKKKKVSFFARLFKKTEINESAPETKIKEEIEQKQNIIEKEKLLVKKTKISALQSISYQFKKIEGLNDKCKQIVQYNNKLLIAGNNGLYECYNNKINTVIKDIYINHIFSSEYNKNRIYIATNKGIVVLTNSSDKWQTEWIKDLDNIAIFSVYEDKNIIWAGGENVAYKISFNKEMYNIKKFVIDSYIPEKIYFGKKDTDLYLLHSSDRYIYNETSDTIVKDNNYEIKEDLKFFNFQSKYFFIHENNKWAIFDNKNDEISAMTSFINMFREVNYIYVDKNKNLWIIDGTNDLYKISSKNYKEYNPEISLYFKQIINPDGIKFNLKEINTGYKNNALKFIILSPFYAKPDGVEYQYYIEGLIDKWSNWSNNTIIDLPYIPYGHYKLFVRARNILGKISEPQSISFKINKPFWLQWWFISIEVILIFLLIVIIIRMREAKLRRDKEILEQKVKERTQTIEEQKEEIEAQRDALAIQNEEILQQKEEIEAQRDEIEAQRDRIVKQNEEIKASIYYAQRIQSAVMPSKELLDKWLKEYFILFKPRDIVSGDFYWATQKDGKIIVAAADCTGHGVPGAFMSMLGISFLNEIVGNGDIIQANIILEELRTYIKNTLFQTGKENEQKDGMDMSLCIFDFKNNILQFAGAYNPVYYITEGELTEIKGDKMPIGIYVADEKSFENKEIKIKKNDVIYICSDGYEDQFGGTEGRKFMAKSFKKLLLEIHKKPMEDQKEILNSRFEEWKGSYPQIDDVLLIGIRV
jgi:serine phosphatase RsbU (regulator of sigma subunit)